MKMNNIGQDAFQTPPHIFSQLNAMFNFTVDAACDSANKLCETGFCFDLGCDGLVESWGGHRVFCNPPFSEKSAWIEKAYNEVNSGNCPLAVLILPTLSESIDAFQDWVFPRYWNMTKVLRQRISFIDPETGKARNGNNSGTTVCIFMKEVTV